MKTTGLLFAAAATVAASICAVGTAHAAGPTIDATFNCDALGDLHITLHMQNKDANSYEVTISSDIKGVIVDAVELQEGDHDFAYYDDGHYTVTVTENGGDPVFGMQQDIVCWGGADVIDQCHDSQDDMYIGIWDEQAWSYDVYIDDVQVASVFSGPKGYYAPYGAFPIGKHHVKVMWLQSDTPFAIYDQDVMLTACGTPAEVDDPTTTTPTTVPAPTQQASEGSLPMTGSHDLGLTLFAVGFLVAGIGLVTFSARRAAGDRAANR